jgi:hypothetical protein
MSGASAPSWPLAGKIQSFLFINPKNQLVIVCEAFSSKQNK